MENKKITIELHSLIKDLIKNLWVIILSALIALMAVYVAGHSVYSPVYTSSATLVVSARGLSSSNAYSNFGISSEMAGVYTNVFVQPSMKEKAAKHLGLDRFDGEISAEVLSETNLMRVSVTSDSPQKSYELLNAILVVYPEISNNVFGNSAIKALTLPKMPTAPSNTISDQNKEIIVSAVIILITAAILAISLYRDTVKTEQAFDEKIDAVLLGTIPHEYKRLSPKERINKTKKSLLINGRSLLSLRFVENFHKIAAKIESYDKKNNCKVIAITSVAENEGKSTVASNIAIALAERGKKVVLLDLDAKKPAIHKIFDLHKSDFPEFGEYLTGENSLKNFSFTKFRDSSLYMAMNAKIHSDYENWYKSGFVERFLQALRDKADYIIIDTAPMTADATSSDIIKIVDGTLVVVRTDKVLSAVISDALVSITNFGGNLIGCVLNDVYPDVAIADLTGVDESGYSYGQKYGLKRYGSKYYANHSNYSKYQKYSNYSYYSAYAEPSASKNNKPSEPSANSTD